MNERTRLRREPSAAREAATRVREGAERRGGEPLAPGARALLEPRFGHSFAEVRVHADGEADALSRELSASAFTVGQDVFFRGGAFEPGSGAGLRLLAHELAHTVQQGRSGAAVPEKLEVRPSGDAAEAEAGAAADGVAAGGSVEVRATAAPSVQRQREEERLGPMDVLTDDMLGGGVDFLDAFDVPGGFGQLGGILGGLSMADGLSNLWGRHFGEGSDAAPSDVEADIIDSGNVVSGLLSLGTMAGALPTVAGSTALGSIGAAGAGTALGATGAYMSAAAPVLGAGLGGYALGSYLSENTTVGDHAVDSMGTIDGWLTGEGERSWMLSTSEGVSEDWDAGNYGSAAWGGLKLGGAATLGALGGLAGGAVDGVKAVGGGIADGARSINSGFEDLTGGRFTLDPTEIEWNPTKWF